MSQYGLPYLGSKSKLAEYICGAFPKAKHFYDLFGGGFAITQCMLERRGKDYEYFHFNELRKGMTDLIKDCIGGKYSYKNFKPEWVSREDFFANKEIDLYKKIVWSFGNNGDDYIFGKDCEDIKRSAHNAVVFNIFDDTMREFFGFDKFKEGYDITTRRLFIKRRIEHLKGNRLDLEQLERLQQLQQLERLQQFERLQQLEQLERLQQLEQLERLHFYNGDYRLVKIEEDSVIYCDIPYESTADYGNSFSHKEFYKWADSIKQPLFISEYNISHPGFKLIFKKDVRSTLAGGAGCKKVEKLYCNDIAYKILRNKQCASRST